MTEPSLCCIVAATRSSLGIGRDGGLPWRLRSEMAYFRDVTTRAGATASTRNAVIMGRNTWLSIPERLRPLRNRINVVLTRSGGVQADPAADLHVSASLADAMQLLSDKYGQRLGRVFIIGGAAVYRAAMALPSTNRILVTQIENEFPCDTYFEPDFRKPGSGWQKCSHAELQAYTDKPDVPAAHAEGGISFAYELWRRAE